MSNKAETKTMKPASKSGLKPKLRFPEFRDAPQWKEKLLEDALSPTVRERTKPVEAYMGLGLRSHGKGTFLKHLVNPEKNSMDYLYEVQGDDLIVNITFAWEGRSPLQNRLMPALWFLTVFQLTYSRETSRFHNFFNTELLISFSFTILASSPPAVQEEIEF